MLKTTRSIILAVGLSIGNTPLVYADERLVLRAASTQNYSTIDPHIGYDWLSFQTLGLLCGTLVVGIKDTADLMPDLAERIEYTNDGKTILFHLDPTRVFHNNQPVRANDVVYSINRSLDPDITTGGASLFWAIRGFDAYSSGETEHIEGVKALSDHVVQIDLERASNSFMYALSMSFGCIVPDGFDMKPFDLPISAGPMQAVGYSEDGVLTFTKFAPSDYAYSHHPDEMQIFTGLSSVELLAKFANNDIDYVLDGLSWEVMSNRIEGANNSSTEDAEKPLALTYLSLNTELAPLDNINVRRAINLAINRDNLVAQLSGAAVPTGQIIPPAFPEYNADKQTNPYDLEEARRLLENIPKPIKVELFAVDSETYRTLVFQIVDDLRKVGIVVSPRFGDHQAVQDVGADPTKGQMVFSDGLGWFPDFFDASNFYFPILAKRSIGGWNWSAYYNPNVEKLAIEADAILGNQNSELRKQKWQEVFAMIESDAPMVPLYNRRPSMRHAIFLVKKEQKHNKSIVRYGNPDK